MTIAWPSLPLRRVGQVISGGTPSADADNWNGEVPFVTPPDMRLAHGGVVTRTDRTVTEKGAMEGSSTAPPGALLVSIRAPIGYVAMLEATSAFNQGCRALVPRNEYSTRFMSYALQGLSTNFASFGRGTTFMEVSGSQFAAFEIPTPDLATQTAIADYLDRETAQIDALIEKQQQLIAILRERHLGAVSSLADEPKNHQPLGRRLARLRQGWSPNCEVGPADGVTEWGVLKTGCMNGGVFRPAENKRLPVTELPRPEDVIMPNEVIISRASSRDWVGSAARVDGAYPRLMLSDLTYGATVDRNLDPRFLVYSLASSRVRGLMQAMAKGTSPSMQKLSQRDLKELPIWVPSIEAQEQIIVELDHQTMRMDNVVGKATRVIELTRERRSALITAAVTGQIDVGSAA